MLRKDEEVHKFTAALPSKQPNITARHSQCIECGYVHKDLLHSIAKVLQCASITQTCTACGSLSMSDTCRLTAWIAHATEWTLLSVGVSNDTFLFF